MTLDKTSILYLRWLAQQLQPQWGAHLERGEPMKNPRLLMFLDNGLIVLDKSGLGYIITEKGRLECGQN